MILNKPLLLISLLCFSAAKLTACDSISVKRYDNGKKEFVKKYENGQNCGFWKFYRPDGIIERKEKYKKGILVFTWFYNEEGKLIRSVNRKGKEKVYRACNCH